MLSLTNGVTARPAWKPYPYCFRRAVSADQSDVANARLVCKSWCSIANVAVKSLTLRGSDHVQPDPHNGRLRSVTSVTLCGYSAVTDSLVDWLTSLPSLEKLCFHCNGLDTIPSLGDRIPRLQYLSLWSYSCEQMVSADVGGLSCLTTLEVTGCLKSLVLPSLAALPLQQLTLTGYRGSQLPGLCSLSLLTSLKIHDCPKLLLSNFSNCTGLQQL